jgi:hypothetical protein
MRAKMRNIVLALIIAVGACALLYLLATVLGFPAEVAKGAAGLPAFSIQKVYEFLETSSAKQALETAGLGPTMSVKEFSIHPISAFLFFLDRVDWCIPFYRHVDGHGCGLSSRRGRY